jgi:uncharacterized protein YfaQ (DUF2300 family)
VIGNREIAHLADLSRLAPLLAVAVASNSATQSR